MKRRLHWAIVPATILFSAATAAALPHPHHAAPSHKPAPSLQRADRLQSLLTQRLEILRQVVALYRAQYQNGLAPLEDLEQATIAVYRTDLQRKHARLEKVALAQQWVAAEEDIYGMTEERVKTGAATQADAFKAQAELLDAEIALEREKTGARGS